MKRLPLFEKKIIINLIHKHCESIALSLSSYCSIEKEPGWMSGLAGISCFFFHYSRFSGSDKYKTMAYLALEKVISYIEKGFSHPSFSTGLAGIDWMLNYLGDQKFITPSEAISLNDLHPMFDKFAMSQFKKGEYDVLHGALGIFVTANIRSDISSNSGIRDGSGGLTDLVKNELTRLAIQVDVGKVIWESINPIDGTREINIGLAHGMPSILLCLSMIYKSTNDQSILSSLIEPGMCFLLENMIEPTDNKSYFPIRIKDNQAQRPSRMAWCYGDPGIAWAIYQIGENCIRPDWQDLATKILKSIATRLDQIDTGVTDACICHGSSGLALIYYAAGLKTAYSPFLETARQWTRTSIDYGISERDMVKYLFKGNSSEYISKYSLLEGISGVGLTLMAVLEGELPGWEKGLMI